VFGCSRSEALDDEGLGDEPGMIKK